MPERLPTAKPTILAGTNLESGTPNTGQVPMTLGGSRSHTRFSGAADVAIWVGGGRLDTLQALPGSAATMPVASGVPIIYYDSAVAAAAGPVAASGHKVVAIYDPRGIPLPALNIFNSGGLAYGSLPLSVGVVFTSGLCVGGLSGALGSVVSYTPAISG